MSMELNTLPELIEDVKEINNDVVDFIQEKINENPKLSDYDLENLITKIFIKISEIKNIFYEKNKKIKEDPLKFQNNILNQMQLLTELDNNFIIPLNYYSEYINLGNRKGCMIKPKKYDLVNPYNSIELAIDSYRDGVIDDVLNYLNPFDQNEYTWITKDIIQFTFTEKNYDFKAVIYEFEDKINNTFYYNVSFRGTASDINFIMDLEIKLKPFNIQVDNKKYDFDLHQGFSRSLFTEVDNKFVIEIILDKLSKIIRPNSRSILLISSHSLGAAIGTIFATYLYSDEYSAKYIDAKIFDKVILNNFGEPRITNTDVLTNLISDINKNKNLVYNQFINNLDIVHCIPPLFLLSYNHVQTFSSFLQLEDNNIYRLKTEKTRNGVLIQFVIYLFYLIKFVKHKISDDNKKIVTNIVIDLIVISGYSHDKNNYKNSLISLIKNIK